MRSGQRFDATKEAEWKVETFIDFTNQSKTCLKDSFSLLRINQIIYATSGHELHTFVDAYLGYNQIVVFEPDPEHTSFITDIGL